MPKSALLLAVAVAGLSGCTGDYAANEPGTFPLPPPAHNTLVACTDTYQEPGWQEVQDRQEQQAEAARMHK